LYDFSVFLKEGASILSTVRLFITYNP
jgi:hypothetical protein